MKWFSFSYVKQKPWLFAGIVIVFGLFFWMLLNRNSGSTVVQAGGKTDAQIAAETQLALAGMNLQGQQAQAAAEIAALDRQNELALAIATMQASGRIAELEVSRELNLAGIAAQKYAMDLSYQQSVNNNAFQLDYAKLAFQSSLAHSQIAADAMKLATLTNVISTFHEKDRDDAFFGLLGATYDNPILAQAGATGLLVPGSGGGGFDFGAFISPVYGAIS